MKGKITFNKKYQKKWKFEIATDNNTVMAFVKPFNNNGRRVSDVK
jgi:hypothetical protein